MVVFSLKPKIQFVLLNKPFHSLLSDPYQHSSFSDSSQQILCSFCHFSNRIPLHPHTLVIHLFPVKPMKHCRITSGWVQPALGCFSALTLVFRSMCSETVYFRSSCIPVHPLVAAQCGLRFSEHPIPINFMCISITGHAKNLCTFENLILNLHFLLIFCMYLTFSPVPLFPYLLLLLCFPSFYFYYFPLLLSMLLWIYVIFVFLACYASISINSDFFSVAFSDLSFLLGTQELLQ